jgi:hypothetical protein
MLISAASVEADLERPYGRIMRIIKRPIYGNVHLNQVRSDLITASFTARSGDVGWPKFRWAGSRASWQLLDFAAGETDILQGSI